MKEATNPIKPTNRTAVQMDNIILFINWDLILLDKVKGARSLRCSLRLKNKVDHGVASFLECAWSILSSKIDQ